MSFFSLESILRVEKKRNYPFRISEDIIANLNFFNDEIGNPLQKVQKKAAAAAAETTSWENVRNKGTKKPITTTTTKEIVRKDDKQILAENINEIRILLNKLTNKTYLDCVKDMVKRLQAFERYHKNGLLDDTIMQKMSETIFHIATHNRFYSKLYADLFSELMFQFEFLKEMFERHAQTIINKFTAIGEYVDEENYDGFCKMNEENDNLKSLAEFFVNLNKNNILSDTVIQDIAVLIMKAIMLAITQDDKKYQADVMADLLAIFYDKTLLAKTTFTFQEESFEFVKSIKKFTKLKTEDFKSLSKKTVFKFMDMYERK
jgi:hypothetical protein